MKLSEIVDAVDAARSVAKVGGRLAVLLVDCPTCEAPRGYRCVRHTWPDRAPSDQVHAARRHDAVDDLRRGPR